uniref:Uncharacterized protein n=1 Tax=Tanacetum cinerariifolium TaxID=118510 RepID=A0A6L2J3T3_TANCI|nr:hypothetical protein [Tanacetum cinerariifolium]
MFLNVEQLEKQLDKEDFQEIGSMAAFNVLEIQFQMFIMSHIYLYDIRRKVDTSKALDGSLVDIESNGTESKEQDTSSRLGNDAHDNDADIRPIYDEEPMAEEKEAAFAKSHHMISSSNSRISSKNMPQFSSNDMVHNHYLEEAKKKTQERSRNSEPSLIPPARSQSTANGSKPNPRSNTQTSRNWPASKNSFVTTKIVPLAANSRNSRNFSDSKYIVFSKSQKCVFDANHESCLTKFLKEVNSRAKKTMPPRSCLRWKPIGTIFKTVGLRWVPTGKIFTSSTTKVDSEPPNGLNSDITNQYKCEQTLDVGASTLYLSTGFKEFSTDEQAMTSDHNSLELRIHDHSNEPCSSKLVLKVVPPANKTATSRQELELLFHQHITMLRSAHPSDTYVFIVKMEIMHEPTSNKLLVGLDNGVAASFQQSQIHHHMLMLKLLRHTKHQDLRIKKAQESKTNTSVNSDIQDLLLRYQVYQGILLASFQDDAKYKHVGQDKRS